MQGLINKEEKKIEIDRGLFLGIKEKDKEKKKGKGGKYVLQE